MKAIYLAGGLKATLRRDLTWACSNEWLRQRLEWFTNHTLENLSPADGFPREVVFKAVVERFKPGLIVNTDAPAEPKPGEPPRIY